jgi:hypothetical protein
MKKILIFGLFLSLLILSGCSLKRAPKSTDNPNQAGRSPDLPQVVNTESRLVAKDDFSLEAPANWKESPALMPGISLMMVNGAETTSNRPEVRKINFRSYFSVAYATLGEKTLEQYTAGLKDKLIQMVAGITFQDIEPTVIDGRPAKVFSASLTQQGVDFKLLMFVAAGKNKDVWLISFNTLAESLSGYQSLFFKIAASFRMK